MSRLASANCSHLSSAVFHDCHPNVLARRALRIEQSAEYPLYLFSLTAKEILQVADISRVARDRAGELIGYQRPEVRQHIDEITGISTATR